nr:translation initiation factor IF-2 [Symphalangus syndactylus]
MERTPAPEARGRPAEDRSAASRTFLHPRPGAPRTSPPARARSGASGHRAAPPPLAWSGFLPWGFTSSPGPGRLPSPGQLQPARKENGELGAGGASLANPRKGLCGRCARPQRANPRTGERLAPAAAAAAPEQPPHAPSTPRSRPGLDSLAGTPSGDPWRPPAEWQLRRENSLWDHLPSGKRWDMTSLRRLPALQKRHWARAVKKVSDQKG